MAQPSNKLGNEEVDFPADQVTQSDVTLDDVVDAIKSWNATIPPKCS